MRSVLNIVILLACLVSLQSLGQCPGPVGGAANCDPALSQMIITNNPNVEFSFDSFGTISGGVELNGSSVIRIKAVNNPAATCKWNLKMYVYNGGGTTPPAEWETLTNYGATTGATPQLDLIQVRVTNFCGTPINNGQWQTFTPLNGSALDIINDVFNLNVAGACNGSQTNSQGSYLTNNGEFSFTIDYKIKPGYSFEPGRYVIKLVYCLSEM